MRPDPYPCAVTVDTRHDQEEHGRCRDRGSRESESARHGSSSAHGFRCRELRGHDWIGERTDDSGDSMKTVSTGRSMAQKALPVCAKVVATRKRRDGRIVETIRCRSGPELGLSAHHLDRGTKPLCLRGTGVALSHVRGDVGRAPAVTHGKVQDILTRGMIHNGSPVLEVCDARLLFGTLS
jgi:hypothetical protein